MKFPFQFPRLKRRGKKKAGQKSGTKKGGAFLKSKYHQRLKPLVEQIKYFGFSLIINERLLLCASSLCNLPSISNTQCRI